MTQQLPAIQNKRVSSSTVVQQATNLNDLDHMFEEFPFHSQQLDDENNRFCSA